MVAIYDERHQFEGHYCFMKDISEKAEIEAERRRAKAAIEKELVRTKTLLNNSMDGIVVMDQQGNVVEASPSFAAMLGYSLEETLRLNFTDWDAQWTATELQAMIAQPRPTPRFETRHRRRDGSTHEVEISWSRVSIDGEVLNFCVCRDISDRKRAEAERNRIEAELRQSEATQQAIIQAIPDLLMRMHADGTHLEFITDSDFNLVDADQVKPDVTVQDVLPPALAQLRLQHAANAVTTGLPQIYEQTVLMNGEAHYEEVRMAPLLQGEVLVMVRDITDKKQTENDLRHQKEMLQTIVTHIPVMIALFDGEGRIIMVNPELEKTLGWALEDWQQCDILVECYPDPIYRQGVIDHMVAATGQWKDLTTLNAQGETLETSWANVPLLNGMSLGIGQDVSDRKHKEAILRQAMEASEAANIAKSQFLANMSHELRTPLNVILGFTQVLSRDPTLTPDQRENLETIRRSGDHLLNLINDVLEMSKIEAGQMVLNNCSFDLARLMRSLQEMFALKSTEKGLKLKIEQIAMPRYICSDEAKLRQILINLLSNAIKFTDQGQVNLKVWIRPSTDQGASQLQGAKTAVTLCFDVTDTGCGIPDAEQDAIFEAFRQTEQGRNSQGTGLGLSISRQFALLMGGISPYKVRPRGPSSPAASPFIFPIRLPEYRPKASATLPPSPRPAHLPHPDS